MTDLEKLKAEIKAELLSELKPSKENKKIYKKPISKRLRDEIGAMLDDSGICADRYVRNCLKNSIYVIVKNSLNIKSFFFIDENNYIAAINVTKNIIAIIKDSRNIA